MDEVTRLERLRRQLPATRRIAYLNTGSVGPLPLKSTEAMHDWESREMSQGRIYPSFRAACSEALAKARANLAQLLGASAEEIVLTHHTTEGVNIVMWGIDWRPGDELITTELEHPAVYVPAAAVAARKGVKVRIVRVGPDGRDALEAIAGALSPRTRLVALSHVAFGTGALLPVGDIARLCQVHRVPVLVDGAQSAGNIPVNMAELGVEFYAVSGQKWLCGPEGTGGLFVRRSAQANLRPTFVGYASVMHNNDPLGGLPHPDARRYEVGSRHMPSVVGLATSLEWLRSEVDWEWAFARRDRLVAFARQIIEETPGAAIITPPDRAGLIAFRLEGVDPEAAVARLAEADVVVRSIKQPSCLRASLAFFNTEEDVERLAEGIRRVAAGAR